MVYLANIKKILKMPIVAIVCKAGRAKQKPTYYQVEPLLNERELITERLHVHIYILRERVEERMR